MDNKYTSILKSYPFSLSDNEIYTESNKIIKDNIKSNDNNDVYKKLYSCIDLTSLNSTDSREHIWKFVESVNEFEGSNPEIDNVASICVFPNFARTVKEALTADVKIACVSAGFPASQTFFEVKIAETALALADGADEIDIVLNLGLFFDEEYEELSEEIDEIKETCRDAKLKVILETGALKTNENIHKASILALYSGADFLKTSTGKIYSGASIEAVYVMCQAIKTYYKKTGKKVGIKVSGGVSSIEDALNYYTIVKDVLGEEWCNKDYFRIGTSRLASTLLEKIKS